MKQTIKDGLKVGLHTTWTLGKVIFPITILVGVLQHTPVLQFIIDFIAPFMGIFGLSGEAAIPLVVGNFLNLYAGIGAILTLELTVKEVFILAVMLSFSHNLLVESTVAAKVGIKIWVILTVRLGLAIFSAIIINLAWKGGGEIAQYGLITASEEKITGYLPILMDAVQKGLMGVFQLALIVIPLMVAFQFFKDLGWLQKFSKWMAPFTRMLGMNENTSTTLAAGLMIGLAYGAGMMIQAVKEDGVSKRDITLAFIFLVACHAVIEDTLIFIPLGIPIWPLLLIRVVTAVVLTILVAFIWKRVEVGKRKEAVYDH
ncbi:nucleoside recognition domain-containing protein [Bacillus sp. FJAT-45066]|uniref:nucleoside recognition domain-containing protein n=1 Tax=Bacillus sp. FJAT-45066 TaxID=2011010 RepID=UPI000BB91018|nr:nucleoside recognition domain-containing protein [Bacillus sp. FJAT-45066]